MNQAELISKLEAENRYLRERYEGNLGAGQQNCAMPMQAGEAAYGLRPESPEETIDYLFTFHDNPDKTPHYIEIREAAKTFAKVVLRHAPQSSDRLQAIGLIRAAVMWSNAAIALDGRSLR